MFKSLELVAIVDAVSVKMPGKYCTLFSEEPPISLFVTLKDNCTELLYCF